MKGNTYISIINPKKKKDELKGEQKNYPKGWGDLGDNQIDLYLSENKLALASLDQFFAPENNDYQKLSELINPDAHKDYWVELDDKAKIYLPKDYKPRKESIFDICQIQNNENCFSNALAYFMEQKNYITLWENFFMYGSCYSPKQGKKQAIGISLTNKEEEDRKKENCYWVKREENVKITCPQEKKDSGRIDLVIRDSKNVIVIENKIKSDINRIIGDNENGQLGRYRNYVKWLTQESETEDRGKKPHYIVLAPNYNIPKLGEDMEEFYKIITYKDLYDFLSEDKNKTIWENDPNSVAFYEAIYRHTHDNINDYLYYEMQEKLMRRIYEKNNN